MLATAMGRPWDTRKALLIADGRLMIRNISCVGC
jgi:hypothetical protein